MRNTLNAHRCCHRSYNYRCRGPRQNGGAGQVGSPRPADSYQPTPPQRPNPGNGSGPNRPGNGNFLDRTLTNVFNNVAPAFPRGENAVDRLAGDKNSSTLVDLLGKQGLVPAVQELEQGGPITVLAPTNKAFENLAKDSPELFGKLTDPRNKKVLDEVLLYHVSGDPTNFQNGGTFDSVLEKDGARFFGNPFYGQFQNGDQVINTGTASVSRNGSVVIPVDQVLIPPDFDPSVLI